MSRTIRKHSGVFRSRYPYLRREIKAILRMSEELLEEGMPQYLTRKKRLACLKTVLKGWDPPQNTGRREGRHNRQSVRELGEEILSAMEDDFVSFQIPRTLTGIKLSLPRYLPYSQLSRGLSWLISKGYLQRVGYRVTYGGRRVGLYIKAGKT